MAKEIISDSKGAVIYNNTSMAAYSPIIRHPEYPSSKEFNKETAMLTREIFKNNKDLTMKEAYSQAREKIKESDIQLRDLIKEYKSN